MNDGRLVLTDPLQVVNSIGALRGRGRRRVRQSIRGICGCSGRSLNFSVDLSVQHHPDHLVVSHKRPQRILKRGRLILLDEEMGYPRQPITWNQGERNKPPSPGGGAVNDPAQRYCGADEVQQTRLRSAVFGNVMWPELVEGFIMTHLVGQTFLSVGLYQRTR